MTIYLVPTGLSVLDNLAKETGEPDWDVAPVDPGWVVEQLTALAKTRAFAADPADAVSATWRREFTGVAGDLDIARWGPSVSAETSTLAARRRASTGSPASALLDPDDTAVLLASQTTAGMCAALIVATALAGGDPGRVHVAETPTVPTATATASRAAAGRYPLWPGQVTVVRIHGLAPDGDNGFNVAAFGIGDVMRAVRGAAASLPAGERRHVDVQLTGGYKAVLLHTMALAEILRSVADPDGTEVTACYLFEQPASRPDAGPPVATDIGLRRFSATFCTTAARALSSVYRHPDRRPQSDDLDGVAWETRHGQRRLNAFGHGYLALLGLQPEVTTEGDRYGR
jgi:hypothetical protein